MTITAKESVYSRITNAIVEQLERGVVPWVQPWHLRMPCNVASNRAYRGINVLSLFAHQMRFGYECHGYLTYRQAAEAAEYIYPDVPDQGDQFTA